MKKTIKLAEKEYVVVGHVEPFLNLYIDVDDFNLDERRRLGATIDSGSNEVLVVIPRHILEGEAQ